MDWLKSPEEEDQFQGRDYKGESVMDSPCVSCKKPTAADEEAMACDVCDNWEHVGCLRHCDRLSKELYEALKGCRSRALLYVCTRCRARGSIVKRLHEYEVESARAHEQRLASAQRMDDLSLDLSLEPLANV